MLSEQVNKQKEKLMQFLRKLSKDKKLIFQKQLLNIGSIYNEEKKKEIKINKEEKVRERKKYEPGQALGAFKVVSYYDNLHYFYDGIIFPNIPLIKQNIDSELRKQIASNNSKHKLNCFITIKYLMQVDEPEEKKVKIEQRYFNSDIINLTSSHVISGFINDLIKSFTCIYDRIF